MSRHIRCDRCHDFIRGDDVWVRYLGHCRDCTVCLPVTYAPPPVAHQSDENASTGVSEGDTRRNGAEKP